MGTGALGSDRAVRNGHQAGAGHRRDSQCRQSIPCDVVGVHLMHGEATYCVNGATQGRRGSAWANWRVGGAAGVGHFPRLDAETARPGRHTQFGCGIDGDAARPGAPPG